MWKRLSVLLVCALVVCGCGNSEKEARTLLNQAIIEWDKGDVESALGKFDLIELEYIKTAAATEAINEKAKRLERYVEENDPQVSREKNRGSFSRRVLNDIEYYYESHGDYPDTLSDIDIFNKGDNRKYLPLCDYKKALFDVGYQLECGQADDAYRSDQISSRRKPGSKESVKTAGGYPKANSTWGEKLNPTGRVPDRGFSAYYIDTNNPGKVIAHEAVDSITINYIYDDFHGIDSKNFGAYWVGYVNTPEQETRRIAISQGWSKARIMIDGAVVYTGDSDEELLLSFEPGKHLVEVEYVNNWHTTEFSVGFLEDIEKLSFKEIKTRLEKEISGGYDLFYAGLCESSSKDLSVGLTIEKHDRPVVLVLSSYSAVMWKLSNPFKTEIKAIVYGSYSPGTQISGDIDSSTMVLFSAKSIGSYNETPNCSCTAGHFHCEGKSMLFTINELAHISDYRLRGFAGKYSATALRVPQTMVNDQTVQELKAKDIEIERLREACKKENDPDFENM